jgi:hypothetical protein
LIDQNTGDPWRDELALDNVAWLAIAPVRKARILRIGPPNDILDAMLGAVQSQQRAAVTVLPPMGFATDQRYQAAVNGESYDLVFFDRCAPPRMEEMPQANTFFIGSVPPSRPNLWDAMTPMKDVLAKEFLHSHPMLRGIETMQGMSVAEARAFPKDQLPPRASALIETNQEPILWAIGRQRFTDLVMTFPLVVEGEAGRQGWNTNWPKQPVGAFPLFFDNVVTQLGRFQEYEKSIVPGVQKPLDPGEAVNEVDIKLLDPPGDFTLKSVRQNNQELSCCPERVGLYNVSWAGAVRYRFAANLFDRDESNIQPRDDFMVGEEEVKKTQEALPQRWPLWPWFVLAALVILMVEWWIYNARIHA